jgi:diguanylate cyclase (GGDEF)-like protein
MPKKPSKVESKMPIEHDANVEFQAKMIAIQDKFKASLPTRLIEIQQAWEQVQTVADKSEALDGLHRLVHRLTGSAGTFGYTRLSLDSRSLEILLESLLSYVNIDYDEYCLKIQDMIDGLVKVADTEAEHRLSQQQASHLGMKKNKNQVLIIEDDKELNQLLTLKLQNFGYMVKSVECLEDLTVAFESFQPNLILADITFPEGDFAGIESVKELLEKYDKGCKIPVIFISARQDIEARLQAVRAKGQAYFPKPIDFSALLNQVRELTDSVESEPYQIVLVDDDPELVGLLTFILEASGMYVAGVTDPKLALEVIHSSKPDLILMELNMPWCSGIELAQVIRQQDSLSTIPIIFLSEDADAEVQFQAVLKGGDGFLSKPIDVTKLPMFIQSKAQRARILSAFMIKDGLTGLYNHSYIKEAVETEMHRLERNHHEFCVAMLDIDCFKKVNDTYGHSIGDQVLRSLSHFLIRHLRKTDKVGRYGGEEFMVVFPETSLASAVAVMNSILEKFRQVTHYALDQDVQVTFSAGVISSNLTQNVAQLLTTVDKGLYAAKHAGRNQVMVADTLAD